MTVHERVVVHVDLDTDPVKNRAKLAAFQRQLNDPGRWGKFNRTLLKTERIIGRVTTGFLKFFKLIGKISFIGLSIEIGLVATALASVRLAMILGRGAISTYKAALTGLGIAAGGVAAAIGVVAGAVRQFSEVALAPFVGGQRQARQAVRGTFSDDLISMFGVEGLQGAVNELARSGVPVAQSYTKILAQLGNFTTDSKQLSELAGIFGQIQKEGKITETVMGQIIKINPVFQKAFAEALGITGDNKPALVAQAAAAGRVTADTFAEVLSGELESTDPFEGQLERMNQTLLGRLKGFLPRMINIWGQIGDPFLSQLTEAFDSFERIIHRGIIRIIGPVSGFAIGTLIPGLERGLEKLFNFTSKLIHETLPRIAEVGEKFSSVMETMRDFFTDIARVFQNLEAGAKVVIQTFGPFFKAIFAGGPTGLGGLIRQMNDLFVKNEAKMLRFGEAFGDLAESIMLIFRLGNQAFVSNIDTITDFIDVLSQYVVPAIREVIALFKDAVMSVLPPLGDALKVIATALTSVSRALRSIMSIPGIGTLLGGAMLFGPRLLAGRGARMAAGGGRFGGNTMAFAAASQLPFMTRMSLGAGGLGGNIGAAYAMNREAGRGVFGSVLGIPGTMRNPRAGGFRGLGRSGMTRFALPALAGFGLGNSIGASEGTGTGMGLGALGGAGAGFLLGGPIGALVGGAAGLIGGFLGGNSLKEAQQQGREAAVAYVDGLKGDLKYELTKGGGRKTLEEFTNAMNDAIENATETARQLGVDEETYRTGLLKEQARLSQDIALRQAELDYVVQSLASSTGMATDEIERMADVVGYDLTTAVNDLQAAAEAIGGGRPFSQALLEDESLDFALRGFQGAGLAIEMQEFASDQHFQSIVDTILAEVRAGTPLGQLDPGLYDELIASIFSGAQLKFPDMAGADLINPAMETLRVLEEQYPELGFYSQLQSSGLEASLRASLTADDRPDIQGVRRLIESEQMNAVFDQAFAQYSQERRALLDAREVSLGASASGGIDYTLRDQIDAQIASLDAKGVVWFQEQGPASGAINEEWNRFMEALGGADLWNIDDEITAWTLDLQSRAYDWDTALMDLTNATRFTAAEMDRIRNYLVTGETGVEEEPSTANRSNRSIRFPRSNQTTTIGGDTFNFEIVGGPNASSEEIAEEVMSKISAKKRSTQERSASDR